MKKALIVLMVSFFLLASLAQVFGDEIAKEGSGTGTTYYVVTWNPVLAHEQEQVQIDYQAIRIHEADNESSIMHHTSINCVGAVNEVKGVFKEMGICTATRPDGDQI
jgi:hypothetical protein